MTLGQLGRMACGGAPAPRQPRDSMPGAARTLLARSRTRLTLPARGLPSVTDYLGRPLEKVA